MLGGEEDRAGAIDLTERIPRNRSVNGISARGYPPESGSV
jgi:hypothetical protein